MSVSNGFATRHIDVSVVDVVGLEVVDADAVHMLHILVCVV